MMGSPTETREPSRTAISIARALLGTGKAAKCYLTGQELPLTKDWDFTGKLHHFSTGRYYRYYGFLYVAIDSSTSGLRVNVYEDRRPPRLVAMMNNPGRIEVFLSKL